ncbi:DUF5689 domain-containing protein [Sphingobacterium bovistauri]|uniref:DUF5689 domain-containing protein n=1 Tax=Sphingobacterium bovistauri TaxID=2781959 RepID=A0ABS7Z6S2_9SPHI|nr:DUF5689 domain-containing protein [Sphingobacterium bovistauri]MCA5005262.1 hypothetical protein [Sphingobacterium bovistauri]
MKSILNKINIGKAFVGLFASVALLSSCENKEQNYIGEFSPYIAIEDIRALYRGSEVKLTSEKISNAKKIYGVVVSDHSDSNLPEDIVIIQQDKRNRTRGIAFKMLNAASYLPGDSLVINIADKSLNKDGFLYLDGISESDIEKVSSGNKFTVRNTNAGTLNAKPNEFESTIIKIVGGEMYPRPTAQETLTGSKTMINGADTVNIVTLASATFANEILPRNINVTGIPLGTKSENYKFDIFPRHLKDIEDISDPEVPEYIGSNPLIITGFLNDPNGGDGNYEYIQLKANVDINFNEVPFSLVLSTNAGAATPNPGAAPGAGWATGGGRTYKFNITEGAVKKGDYFYVGGHQRRINGPNSTSINSANWARYIQYSNTAGDGLGNASSGLLPNSGNAGGMAVFIGVNVTEKSVPIDVVWFGGNSNTTIVDVENEKGYRISNNDHYRITNTDDSSLQPFFSMGTNTYRIPHITPTDLGAFVKLGGVFNTTKRQWTTPRGYTFTTLTKASVLSEIESGDGTTIQED